MKQRMGVDLQRAHQHRRDCPDRSPTSAMVCNIPVLALLRIAVPGCNAISNSCADEATSWLPTSPDGWWNWPYTGQGPGLQRPETTERIRGSKGATTWADAADIGLYNNEIEDYHRGNMDTDDEANSDEGEHGVHHGWPNTGSTTGVKPQHPWINGILKQQRWMQHGLPQLRVEQRGQQHPSM